MQILEIYIHTIIYIHIHTYTTSSTTTTHTTHTTGGRGVLIHSYTYIYNFFHHHHHPPPPTPPTPQGGGGYWGATKRPITMGWGGGRYLAMLAHIYIYIYIYDIWYLHHCVHLSVSAWSYRTVYHGWFSSHGSFKPISEAWHLSQLMLLFMTQAAMELDSRGLLALLLLSLLLGSKQRW